MLWDTASVDWLDILLRVWTSVVVWLLLALLAWQKASAARIASETENAPFAFCRLLLSMLNFEE